MSARLRFLTVFLIVLTLMMAPEALGCPVCFDSKEKNRAAFVLTTWVLTFVPLSMIGGIIWWLHKKVRDAERVAEQQSHAA